jgi:hypothetical protein
VRKLIRGGANQPVEYGEHAGNVVEGEADGAVAEDARAAGVARNALGGEGNGTAAGDPRAAAPTPADARQGGQLPPVRPQFHLHPSLTYIRHRVISASTTPTASLGTSVLPFARGSHPGSSRSGGRIRGRRSSRAAVRVAGVVLRYEGTIGAFDSTAARLINFSNFSYSSRVLRTRPMRPFASTYRPEIYKAWPWFYPFPTYLCRTSRINFCRLPPPDLNASPRAQSCRVCQVVITLPARRSRPQPKQ